MMVNEATEELRGWRSHPKQEQQQTLLLNSETDKLVMGVNISLFQCCKTSYLVAHKNGLKLKFL